MSYNIAVAGKGGTGKTSITGLTIDLLKKRDKGPILAVDADANANLGDVLGVRVENTIGDLREDVLEKIHEIPLGIPKEQYIEYQIQQAVVETKGLDLIVMGRPEGPGCYCYANTLIRKYIDIISGNYTYIVIDNEAGMEHLSRRTTQNIDLLLIISDPTIRGLRTVTRIIQLVSELKLKVKRSSLIINRLVGKIEPSFKKVVDALDIELAGVIPHDNLVSKYDLEGKPLTALPKESKAVEALESILEKLNIP